MTHEQLKDRYSEVRAKAEHMAIAFVRAGYQSISRWKWTNENEAEIDDEQLKDLLKSRDMLQCYEAEEDPMEMVNRGKRLLDELESIINLSMKLEAAEKKEIYERNFEIALLNMIYTGEKLPVYVSAESEELKTYLEEKYNKQRGLPKGVIT